VEGDAVKEAGPNLPHSGLLSALVVVLTVVVTLALAELGLRLAGFQPGRVNAGYLQFGYRTGIPTFDEDGLLSEGQPLRLQLFGADPDLLWVPLPGTPYTNSRGFRGREEYPLGKPAGALRVLYIGDSVGFLGDPPYPAVVDSLLQVRFPGRPIECINASVPGYTIVQGRRRWERLAAYRPDMVVVYFGWNDHWPARGGLTDSDQFALAHGPRLLGLLRGLRGRWRSAPPNRVPLPEFEATLTALRDEIMQAGALPLLVTAPTGYRTGAMSEWAVRFFSEFYGMTPAAVAAVPAVHEAYADAVRRVARGGRAVLVDAAQEMADDDPLVTYRTDQIHLRQAGHQRLASLLAKAIARRAGI
jgi:lysophospholipase L1-like esterase